MTSSNKINITYNECFPFTRKGWDTPLKDLGIRGAPVFSDDFRSTHVCLRDILAHKLGIELGESDFGWVCDAFPSTYHLMKYANASQCNLIKI